jgi:hypothetical protein
VKLIGQGNDATLHLPSTSDLFFLHTTCLETCWCSIQQCNIDLNHLETRHERGKVRKRRQRVLGGKDDEDGAPLAKAHVRPEEYAREYFAAQKEFLVSSYSAWFDMGVVAYVERPALSEFFSSRTAPRRPRSTTTTTSTRSSSSGSSSTTR